MSSRSSRLARFGRFARELPRRVIITLIIVAALLVGARIALPFVLERLINDRSARVQSYDGRVVDIDVYLLRGAYAINGIALYREKGSRP